MVGFFVVGRLVRMQLGSAQAGHHGAAERRQHWTLGRAVGERVPAARREGATRGGLEGGRRPAGDDRQAPQCGVD
jgi:hypothetical protein